MSLLAEVLTVLRERSVGHGLIGGVAMAAHGVARATLDTDILVVDPVVLESDLWAGAISSLESVEVRHGDSDDPLAGLVRICRAGAIVDVVVGRPGWQGEALERTVKLKTADGDVPVVDLADLVLLKLYAGGPQDFLDMDLLLADADTSVLDQIEERLVAAPKSVRQAWRSRRDRSQ